jgi:hypothetical protein
MNPECCLGTAVLQDSEWRTGLWEYLASSGSGVDVDDDADAAVDGDAAADDDDRDQLKMEELECCGPNM